MIFVTVGTQIPFDRLIGAVDSWAASVGRDDVFAQVGEGAKPTRHIRSVPSLAPGDFGSRFAKADAIVGHAGMGTILGALQHGKPLIVMPRRASLGEHRNEHQLATARRFRERGLVHVAMDEEELAVLLARIDSLECLGRIGDRASEELLSTLRKFTFEG